MFFPKKRSRRQDDLRQSTVRDFSGGLDVLDNDLNLSPKYARVLDNMERAPDGSLSLRPGTKLFGDVSDVETAAGAYIVNAIYYQEVVVIVMSTGRIITVDGTGAGTSRSTLFGATTFVSFSPSNGQLIICNGLDKPLLMDTDYSVDYLQDLATLSNTNTPIGKFCATHYGYTIIAGDPLAISTIHISARNASGTYQGDPDPNDAVAMNLGVYVPEGSSEITGIASYRDRLVVFFESCSIPVELGIYTDAVHTPTVIEGAMVLFGAVSHRGVQALGDDVLFPDGFGVNSITRTTLTSSIRPERVSELIAPLVVAAMGNLSRGTVAERVFSVYDQQHRRYMLFIPDADTPTETYCFSYTYIPTAKVTAWARLRGWNWRCACRTLLGNIIFGRDKQLYSYNFADTDIVADYVDDQESFSDDTFFDDGYGLSPDSSEQAVAGVPITFTWEMPWFDLDKRTRNKMSKYISFDTSGTGQFTVSMYVDNIITDGNGDDAPALTMDFVGGSVSGYGASGYGFGPYGGGRMTRDERLYAWPAKYHLAKLIFTGTTKQALKIVAVTLHNLVGSIRR